MQCSAAWRNWVQRRSTGLCRKVRAACGRARWVCNDTVQPQRTGITEGRGKLKIPEWAAASLSVPVGAARAQVTGGVTQWKGAATAVQVQSETHFGKAASGGGLGTLTTSSRTAAAIF